MGMETTGKVYLVRDTQQVSERFSKREFVLELADNPKYPQLVMFQATGDRCAQLDGIQEGDSLKVEFSLRGREWKAPSGDVKYFNTLDVWKVERVGASASRSAAKEQPSSGSAPVGGPVPDDDIPFASCDIGHEPTSIARCLR